jgi:hypothetical protein
MPIVFSPVHLLVKMKLASKVAEEPPSNPLLLHLNQLEPWRLVGLGVLIIALLGIILFGYRCWKADYEALLCRGMGMDAYESMKGRGISPVVTDIADIDKAVISYGEGNIVDQVERLHLGFSLFGKVTIRSSVWSSR